MEGHNKVGLKNPRKNFIIIEAHLLMNIILFIGNLVNAKMALGNVMVPLVKDLNSNEEETVN